MRDLFLQFLSFFSDGLVPQVLMPPVLPFKTPCVQHIGH